MIFLTLYSTKRTSNYFDTKSSSSTNPSSIEYVQFKKFYSAVRENSITLQMISTLPLSTLKLSPFFLFLLIQKYEVATHRHFNKHLICPSHEPRLNTKKHFFLKKNPWPIHITYSSQRERSIINQFLQFFNRIFFFSDQKCLLRHETNN